MKSQFGFHFVTLEKGFCITTSFGSPIMFNLLSGIFRLTRSNAELKSKLAIIANFPCSSPQPLPVLTFHQFYSMILTSVNLAKTILVKWSFRKGFAIEW